MARLAGICFLTAAVLAWPGCGESPSARRARHPRIVSFSPALTGMLFEMGLGANVVAVTTQCVLPPGEHRPRVGDILHVEAEQILALKPDLLLIQSKPEMFQGIEQLCPEIRIEHFTIESLSDIAAAIRRIGVLVDDPSLGEEHARRFQEELAAVSRSVEGLDRPRVLYVLGYQRPVVAGKGTFIGEMIELAGGVNAGDPGKPHPLWRQIDIEGVVASAPDVVFCEVSAAEAQAAKDYWLSVPGLPAARTGRVHVVSDPRWSVPSSYSAKVARQMARIIHPSPAQGESPHG